MRSITLSSVFLVSVMVTSLINVNPVSAGIFGDVPVITLQNGTKEIPENNQFFDTEMKGTFKIGQVDMSSGNPLWLWQETHEDIRAPPGGLIGEHPISLKNKITSGPDLVVSYEAEMLDDSSNTVGYAYAFEEGQTPPQSQPNSAPWIVVPLADPRPTPWRIYGYSSPPVKVGSGSVGFSFTMLDFKQDMINLKSKDNWVTANIQLPEGYNVNDILLDTVLLNDAISAGWGRVSSSAWGRASASRSWLPKPWRSNRGVADCALFLTWPESAALIGAMKSGPGSTASG